MIYQKDIHPLGRINHIPRVLATTYGLLIAWLVLGSSLLDSQFIWIIPTCLFWPHFALLATNLSSNGRRQEQINMHLDAFFTSLIVLATPTYSFASTIITILIANALFVGSYRLMFSTMLVVVSTVLIGAITLPDLHLLDEQLNTIIASSIFLLIYLSAFALAVYKLTRQLIKLNSKVKTLSLTDPLTHCYNRLYLEDSLNKEIQRSYRFKIPLTVIFADLDHFKKINDQEGHNAGDIVLKEFVQLVSTSIRNNVDWIARFGGEEFIITLPNTSAENGAKLANRIREKVSQHNFVLADKPIHVSCSFGVTEIDFNKDELNAEQLTSNADQALYKAKENGRNRVEIFTEKN
ncbi:GGDEF domain-containing protein [uncultured Paraglaciecola sp.]|uniref:sensor domain-containing diguanylate cyclase n=1 Tax=uncultured Paraglaciecola sp. TaxID=1765024 RepID=UPI0025D1DCE9|nr:GGDEF domain-containing protein [uncultured Paraglaciecola sp.]